MEHERKLRGDEEKCFEEDVGEFSGAAAVALHCASAAAMLDDDIAADKQWEKHLALNQSIIFDSFQGQFKSTVCIPLPIFFSSLEETIAKEHIVCACAWGRVFGRKLFTKIVQRAQSSII